MIHVEPVSELSYHIDKSVTGLMHANENTRNILGVCLNVNPLTKLGPTAIGKQRFRYHRAPYFF